MFLSLAPTAICALLCVYVVAVRDQWRYELLQSEILAESTNRPVFKTYPSKSRFENCGDPSNALIFKSIEISPDPPKIGEQVLVTVIGDLKQVIEEGAHVDVSVYLGHVKLFIKYYDICEELQNAEDTTQCPIKPGAIKTNHTINVLPDLPSTTFTIKARVYTVEDKDLACADIKVDLVSPEILYVN